MEAAGGWVSKLTSSAVLEKVQAASGLAFSGFLGLHLANAWLAAPLGQVAYDEVQAVLRRWYQVPVLAEPLVVFLPLVVHAVTAVVLVNRRLQRELAASESGTVVTSRTPWHLTLHRFTG
jgi:succinate dehydrogenase/fumarate reductase cytochrome b subunit